MFGQFDFNVSKLRVCVSACACMCIDTCMSDCIVHYGCTVVFHKVGFMPEYALCKFEILCFIFVKVFKGQEVQELCILQLLSSN